MSCCPHAPPLPARADVPTQPAPSYHQTSPPQRQCDYCCHDKYPIEDPNDNIKNNKENNNAQDKSMQGSKNITWLWRAGMACSIITGLTVPLLLGFGLGYFISIRNVKNDTINCTTTCRPTGTNKFISTQIIITQVAVATANPMPKSSHGVTTELATIPKITPHKQPPGTYRTSKQVAICTVPRSWSHGEEPARAPEAPPPEKATEIVPATSTRELWERVKVRKGVGHIKKFGLTSKFTVKSKDRIHTRRGTRSQRIKTRPFRRRTTIRYDYDNINYNTGILLYRYNNWKRLFTDENYRNKHGNRLFNFGLRRTSPPKRDPVFVNNILSSAVFGYDYYSTEPFTEVKFKHAPSSSLPPSPVRIIGYDYYAPPKYVKGPLVQSVTTSSTNRDINFIPAYDDNVPRPTTNESPVLQVPTHSPIPGSTRIMTYVEYNPRPSSKFVPKLNFDSSVLY